MFEEVQAITGSSVLVCEIAGIGCVVWTKTHNDEGHSEALVFVPNVKLVDNQLTMIPNPPVDNN